MLLLRYSALLMPSPQFFLTVYGMSGVTSMHSYRFFLGKKYFQSGCSREQKYVTQNAVHNNILYIHTERMETIDVTVKSKVFLSLSLYYHLLTHTVTQSLEKSITNKHIQDEAHACGS